MTSFFSVNNLSNDAEDIEFWVKYNGVDFPNSGITSTIRARKSAGVPSAIVLPLTFIGTSLNPNDTVEIYWAGTSTDLSIKSYISGSVDGGPAAPSAVANFIPITGGGPTYIIGSSPAPIIVSTPTTSSGALGDKYGDVAFTSTYFYFCTNDYTTGSSQIWERIETDATAW